MTKKIAAPLMEWYEKNKRPLPFRLDPSPYRIWISEIMAQQTRIEAMLGYYERFIETFPDLASLAQAEDELLVKVWQGLGYYSRARNLKKCAQVVMRCYSGQLPSEKSELMRLPGIGPYTAGAIASIAFGKRESAIDGNVSRVFARLYNYPEEISRAKARRQIEFWVEQELPEAPFCSSFNQALMELGAAICTPRSAHCGCCPIADQCEARKAATVSSLPVKGIKKARKVENPHLLIPVFIEDHQLFVQLKQRPATGLLAGLYGFEEQLDPDLEVKKRAEFIQSRHIFSHTEWNMSSELLLCQSRNESFYTVAQIEESIPVPGAFAPFIDELRRLDLGAECKEGCKSADHRPVWKDTEPPGRR